MSEKPIIFSAPMVRAILSGSKTQTRRIIKDQPAEEWHPEVGIYAPTRVDRHGEEYPGPDVFGASDESEGRVCPYGKPGDRLWVKETFTSVGKKNTLPLWYRADAPAGERVRVDAPWRPAIFMSRAFSRITLEITDVRVQRLQEISEEDALAEGTDPTVLNAGDRHFARGAFHAIWESINGFGSWMDNPWIWALTFRRIEAAERAA